MKGETIALWFVGVAALLLIVTAGNKAGEKRDHELVQERLVTELVDIANSHQEMFQATNSRVSATEQSVDRLYNRVVVAEQAFTAKQPTASYAANAYCTIVQNGSYATLGCRKW